MVKRYAGGLIGATPPAFSLTTAPGIWTPADYLHNLQLGLWPLRISKIGTTTYDFTNLGSYVHVDNLITELGPSRISQMPDSGFMKYTIKTGVSTSNDITVRYTKSGSGNFTQSAFSLLGQTLAYTSAVSSILLYSNDDHDSLAMDGDGNGVINRGNNNIFTGNWDKFQGTTEVVTNSAADSVFLYSPSSFLGTSAASLISFPKTGSVVWLNISNSTYRTNNFNSVSMPSYMSQLGTANPANSLYSISDGVNSFILGRSGSGAAVYCTVNLTTGVITETLINVKLPTLTNSTEEDIFGTQLFLVDGRATFFSNGNFYYGGSRYWRTPNTAWTDVGDMISFAAGSANSQTGMDIFGSVDTSGWLWFADWGHDDGGIFNVGNDNQLGIRQTNIRLIPENYTD